MGVYGYARLMGGSWRSLKLLWMGNLKVLRQKWFEFGVSQDCISE